MNSGANAYLRLNLTLLVAGAHGSTMVAYFVRIPHVCAGLILAWLALVHLITNHARTSPAAGLSTAAFPAIGLVTVLLQAWATLCWSVQGAAWALGYAFTATAATALLGRVHCRVRPNQNEAGDEVYSSSFISEVRRVGLDGAWRARPEELLTPTFLAANTSFATWEDMWAAFQGAGPASTSRADLDAFVRASTEFRSFAAMLLAAKKEQTRSS